MKRNYKFMQLSVFLFMVCILFSSTAFAENHHNKKSEMESLIPVANETYKKECGTCHFTYQPGLLPADSWKKIINSLPSHFEEKVLINEKSVYEIEKYLYENSAENSPSKRSRKILRSLNGQIPLRISETPYIREKHHELSSTIFTRPAIGSKSNCIACHTTAAQGDYDDDNVKIPQ